MTEKPPCRLSVILAREVPVAVIFRRGPSKWVRLIKWHTDTDELEFGHWFHGRIDEKQSDLSPDGSLLIYFASKYSTRTINDDEYTCTWTAISHPPWLTALALWPKGDCWGGGGLFSDNKTVRLGHSPDEAIAHKDHQPQGLVVIPCRRVSGEDNPGYAFRLMRDGWRIHQQMQLHKISYGYVTDRPEIWSKGHQELKINLLMENSIRKFYGVSRYFLESQATGEKQLIPGASWADWDHRGRLVFTGEGKLFAADISASLDINSVEIADFSDDEPLEIAPPEWAKVW